MYAVEPETATALTSPSGTQVGTASVTASAIAFGAAPHDHERGGHRGPSAQSGIRDRSSHELAGHRAVGGAGFEPA